MNQSVQRTTAWRLACSSSAFLVLIATALMIARVFEHPSAFEVDADLKGMAYVALTLAAINAAVMGAYSFWTRRRGERR